jgi:hypothetical protein
MCGAGEGVHVYARRPVRTGVACWSCYCEGYGKTSGAEGMPFPSSQLFSSSIFLTVPEGAGSAAAAGAGGEGEEGIQTAGRDPYFMNRFCRLRLRDAGGGGEESIHGMDAATGFLFEMLTRPRYLRLSI